FDPRRKMKKETATSYRFSFYLLAPNAMLRGEQRNTGVAANHLNHKNQRIVKMPRVANPS
ncbi:hypothetical protein ACQ7JO_004486, partial [Vibrio parahaemolyticus]